MAVPAAAASSSMSTIGATRLAPGACAGDAAIATQFGSGSRVSGSRAMPSRALGGAGRARRATVVASVARPPVPRRLAIPGSPAVDARARLSWGAVPREVSQDGGDVSSARDTRRGARVAARGSLRPRGITDEEWARQQRESNPNYRQFTQRAKDRIAAKGPMIGDMVRKNVAPPKPMPGQPPPEDKYLINMEMLGRHPDMEEPKWRSMKQMSTSEFHRVLRDGEAKMFQVWDPPQRNEKFPPKVFQKPLRPRRYVVTLKNDEVRWVDTVHEELDRAMRHYADASATWYTYHQKPDQNKFNSWQYLGSAVGGFVFLTGSIYLGIKRKHAIPTDAIQAIEFAQSRADARKDAQVEVTLEDVGGLENIVEDLNEVIAFLKNPESFKRLGAKPPKGLLMEGGPGVGKTLIAKAIAGEAEVPFYSMSGAEFVEIIVGVGAARVRDLFKRARLNAPCLIFVDEIDALGTKRAAAGTRGTEEHEQTLNQLLTEMDGFTPDTGVVFIGATNRADLLDPALMRPGRFDRKVTVPQPGIDARAKILQIHLAKRNVDPDIDTLQLAKNLPGLSGAELANICNEAAAVAVRRGADRIETPDVMEATDRVTNGLRHPIPNKDNDVVHRMTRHELGHALVATVLYEANGLIEPVERVSIIPRGRDPTQTTYNRKRDEDYLFPTRARLLERVQVLLAGRAAEEVFFDDDITSYGSADARDANDLVRNVVVNYALGQPDLVTTYTYDPDTLFTPERTIATRKSRVASTGEMGKHEYNRKLHGYGRLADFDHYQYAERKILQIINEAMRNNRAILEAHRAAMDVAFAELLEKDTLLGERLAEIIAENPPTGSFPTAGPDTPCKPLPTEDEEEEAGTRTLRDPAEKMRHAVENYYPQVGSGIENLRDRTGGKPNGKEPDEITLGDYMPELAKEKHQRERLIPKEPWGVIAMKENLADDPDWLRKEHVRFTKVADDERLEELTTKLVPELEAKMTAAKFSSIPTESDIEAGAVVGQDEGGADEEETFTAYTRHGAHQKVGKDGLTQAERRRLKSYRDEISAIREKWSGDGWTPDEETASLSPIWRKDLQKSEEELKLIFQLGQREGEMAYEVLQDIKRDFEEGGYVRTWNGKYYKKEECVLTPRGEWSRKEDLAKEEKQFELDKGKRYDWLFDMKMP